MSSSTLGTTAHLKITPGASLRPLFAASAPSAPPPRPASSSIGSSCSATSKIGSNLKPGTRVQVRTRTLAKIDGKTLVLWLVATVVSATDADYEIIYEGNLPRDNPFSTVHVPLHHVRPIKLSSSTPPPPLSQPPRATASSSASATNTPSARPNTAGKSLRILQTLWPEMQLPSGPASGKGIHLVDKFVSEMKLQAADANLPEESSLQNSPPPRAANPTLAAASKTSKMKSAPRPTPAGKIDRLIHSRASKMKPTPRPSTAGKSLRGLIDNLPPETKPDSRPTTAGKSIHVIRRLFPEIDSILDADHAAHQLSYK